MTGSDVYRRRVRGTKLSIYWSESEPHTTTLPASALRAIIEKGSKALRQGKQVREGVIVTEEIDFDYNPTKYGTTMHEIAQSGQFTVPVVVQRNRILRTRAEFDDWSSTCSDMGR